MIAHEKGFKFHAQHRTGAFSCLKNDPLDESKKMPPSKKFYFFQEFGQKRKIVIKIRFTPLSLIEQGIFAKIGPDLELRGGSDFFTS